MPGYDFAAVEKKWQARWEEAGTFRQPNPDDEAFEDRPKFYVLDMFPYPSGAGLHVGHPVGYVATDVVARYKRMKGFNVMHPMGYDAFGLPAEQYAIEHGVHPRLTTKQNIANMERQLKMFGFSYDWSRRIATTDPKYYCWTQWIFLQMFNSWYDVEADAARPISELVRKLQSGQFVVDATGRPVRNTSDGIAPVMGDPVGTIKWHELSPQRQREIIDSQRLAYMAEVPVNWCPKLGTVLANEEVTNEGRSERGNYPVYRRAMRQWMLRITAYSDRLLEDLELVDWPEPIKIMQRNWIGKSTGANVIFPVVGHEDFEIEVYTTRPDTLFGATYMVLAPEHPLVDQITTDDRRKSVNQYARQAARKSELERTAETKAKTGVFTGAYATNPVNDEKIPIWIADYVMMGYGTGAIMAVPAHDTRDLEFAEQFNLPVIQVVQPPEGIDWRGYVADGIAVNSGKYDGLPTAEFKKKITEDLERRDSGRAAVNYKLRDWIFSRQKYWGEPFPIVHCEKCGTVALPEESLPLTLPEMEDFTPETSGDPDAPPAPPLGRLADWAETTCPECGSPAKRELNTMPQWAGSCWYYLRYLDPANDNALCAAEIEKYWMGKTGVDLYVGGAEHAVLHLLYARFWHKVLHDLGYASTSEPFRKLFNQGMIRSFAYRDGRDVCISYDKIDFREDGACHAETGEKLSESVEKMSKSLKNVINPDDVIRHYGADTFRMYEMFMGPLEASKPWNTRDVPGAHRFAQRAWRMIVGDDDAEALLTDAPGDEAVENALHKLIKKVGEDIEALKFNTAIAAMMEFVNTVYKAGSIARDQAERFLLLLAPFAPHMAEELWDSLGHKESLALETWPIYDKSKLAAERIEVAVQINGKVRGRITVAADADEQAVVAAALAEPKVAAAIKGKKIAKKIIVPGRLVNLVAE
ncbi:MAG: leucine--tRNA ligase [Planctomycetota bacterium]|jgi:leucyl-tRNA synthetase